VCLCHGHDGPELTLTHPRAPRPRPLAVAASQVHHPLLRAYRSAGGFAASATSPLPASSSIRTTLCPSSATSHPLPTHPVPPTGTSSAHLQPPAVHPRPLPILCFQPASQVCCPAYDGLCPRRCPGDFPCEPPAPTPPPRPVPPTPRPPPSLCQLTSPVGLLAPPCATVCPAVSSCLCVLRPRHGLPVRAAVATTWLWLTGCQP
jgi:hypothetical protein